MKKIVFVFFVLLVFANFGFSQYVDIFYPSIDQESLEGEKKEKEKDVEILKNGNIDFFTNGEMQASARVFKIRIGEPRKFYLPLVIYMGSSGNSLGENDKNKSTASNLTNPIGGMLNISLNGLQMLNPKSNTLTKLRIIYQLGIKLVNGEDNENNENSVFLNGFGSFGFSLQTGAWANDDISNMGVFWVQAKAIALLSSKAKLEKIYGQDIEGNMYGYSIEGGIEIDKVINLKVGVYKYLNHNGVEYFKKPIIKFSVDYSF